MIYFLGINSDSPTSKRASRNEIYHPICNATSLKFIRLPVGHLVGKESQSGMWFNVPRVTEKHSLILVPGVFFHPKNYTLCHCMAVSPEFRGGAAWISRWLWCISTVQSINVERQNKINANLKSDIITYFRDLHFQEKITECMLPSYEQYNMSTLKSPYFDTINIFHASSKLF